MTDAPDVFTPEVIAARKEMRELWERHRHGFEVMVDLLQRSGKNWRNQLPPIPKGKDGSVLQVTNETLAWLLADWHLSKAKGIRKEKFAEASAKMGCRHGHVYAVGSWGNVDTILDYIAKAQSLAKRDPDFKALVAARCEDLAAMERVTMGGKAT